MFLAESSLIYKKVSIYVKSVTCFGGSEILAYTNSATNDSILQIYNIHLSCANCELISQTGNFAVCHALLMVYWGTCQAGLG